MTSFDPLAWWGRADGTRTALLDVSTHRRYSYAELDADADRWCAWLVAEGVLAGDRVAVLAQNCVAFVPLLFGCIRCGAILLPLNWRLSAIELARVLADAQPRLLLGAADFATLGETARGVPESGVGLSGAEAPGAEAIVAHAVSVPWFDLDAAAASAAAMTERQCPGPVPMAEAPALLLYTSGSTGAPKGVLIPQRQLLANAIATIVGWQLSAADVAPVATPFFHTGAWNVFLTPLLFVGGTSALVDGFEPTQFLDVLERCDVTVAFVVPTQLAMMSSSSRWGVPLPRLRWLISGGAPCPQRIRDVAQAAGYRIREGYGLTECGPNCFASTDGNDAGAVGTVGWPVPFLDARVRDSADGEALVDVVGELQLRGPQLFGGYFRAPELTRNALTSDGWLCTGDLASRDAEGRFRIRGRRKEMYISGGENVFPGEVESALMDCPLVQEVCVVGLADLRWGEVGCAVVVPTPVRDDGEALEHTEARALSILAAARSRLAGYKVPKHVHFVDALPRLGSGKIDRAAVLAWLLDRGRA